MHFTAKGIYQKSDPCCPCYCWSSAELGVDWTAFSGTTLFLMSTDEMEWGELLSMPLLLNLGDIPNFGDVPKLPISAYIYKMDIYISFKIALLTYVR